MAAVRRADAGVLREATIPQQSYTSASAPSLPLAPSCGPRPAWMTSVPTPFTRAACATGSENERPRPTQGGCCSSSETGRLAELVKMVIQPSTASDPARLLALLTELRKAVSTQIGPQIQQVLDLGALSPILSLLSAESAAIQLQAAWIVTNVAAGCSAHAAAVIEAGGLQCVFAALESPALPDRADLCSQLLWILGNMAGDEDSSLRDRLLQAEVVGHIGKLYAQIPGFAWDEYGRTQVLRTLTWLMSCLCGGRPAPKLEEVDCAFDYFAQVVTGTDDMEMSSEALWGLHHLLDGASTKEDADARVARMLSAGFGPGEAAPPNAPHPVVAQIANSLGSPGNRRIPTVAPAMKILGVLIRTSNSETMHLVLAAGTLKGLGRVLADSQSDARHRQASATALSVVAAGTWVQKLIDDRATYKALQGALERSPTPEVRRECAWAIGNMARQGAPVLSRMDCKELLRLLSVALGIAADSALQLVLLDGVEAVLRHSANQSNSKRIAENPLQEAAEAFGLIEKLEELQHAESEGIYRRSVLLLENFFGADGENEPPTQVPKSPSAGQHRLADCRSPSGAHSAIYGSPARPGYQFGA